MSEGVITRCKRCGRRLTNEKSIRLGYGMTCWKRRFRVVPLDEWGIIYGMKKRKNVVGSSTETEYNKST